MVLPMKPELILPDGRADLDQLVNAQLRAEHDGDVEALLAPMAATIVHDVVGSTNNAVQGLEAVRRRYHDLLAATVHERDVPLRRLYGPGFVRDGHGRWISHRVLGLMEVRDGRIVRETVWNDIEAIRRQLG